jgi:hypothetical protein
MEQLAYLRSQGECRALIVQAAHSLQEGMRGRGVGTGIAGNRRHPEPKTSPSGLNPLP